ncbi:MAG: hypothetical protein KC731_04580, partial [Myxococcales bacterium]|nr:hypothetical protein [Myxococcales bacterium]
APKKKASKKRDLEPPTPEAPDEAALRRFLETPPPAVESDEHELVRWCAGIVGLARKNGYLSNTADAIAVYQTSVLLARMRNRAQPSPYDFRDAAITCIEKGLEPPGKRDVGRLCDMLLGGDRTGQVGYESLPPLARDVYDRLEVLPIQVSARTVQRALLDFEAHPEYLPASDLLWKLRYLIGDDYTVRPIMGERSLGAKPKQESWDIAIGKRQGAVIELGYEGITVEHVIERRLKKVAFAGSPRCLTALAATEDSILYLDSERLTEELGEQAVALLPREPDLGDARDIYRRIARLIHFYRAERGLPTWAERFVTTGYSHYCTLLPEAFADRGVSAEQLSAMLEFILTLESLALALGCERSQLLIAVKQCHTDDQTKLGLLWSVECVLSLRDFASLRLYFDELLDNDLALAALPDYLSGFLLALAFTPLVAAFTVELMSKAFERLPDHVLMPWVPKLLMTLKAHGATGLPSLLQEATAMFPRSLAELDAWQPPWLAAQRARTSPTAGPEDPRAAAARALLWEHRATSEALAQSLGLDLTWHEAEADAPTSDPRVAAARDLLAAHPETLEALPEPR